MSKAKLNIVTETPEFKIERGIALASRKRLNRYASVFSTMKAGESFLIGKNIKLKNLVNYYSNKWSKENNAKFAFRITEEGHRCWRIS